MTNIPKPPNNLKLADQLCFPLYAATHTLTKLYQPYLNALSLTYPQFLVMLTLWENNGQIVTEIGKILRLDTGTLTPLIKRLESMGLVERLRSTDDKRRVVVSLTKRGKALYENALQEKLPLLGDVETLQCQDNDLPRIREDLYQLLARMDKIISPNKS